MANFTGTSGNDNQNGTNSADSFDYSQGGKDTLSGKEGNDTFTMGAALTGADSIDGGVGFDTVSLSGDYAAGVTFGAATMTNVERLVLAAGFDYVLTLDNASVTIGSDLLVDATGLGTEDDFLFDGSDESSSGLLIAAGAGVNLIHGGGGSDVIDISLSPFSRAFGHDGDDMFRAGANFQNGELFVDGGAGRDVLQLDGEYFDAGLFAGDAIHGIEKIALAFGHLYNLRLGASSLNFGEALTIDGSELGFEDALTLDASLIEEGQLQIRGGRADDTVMLSQTGDDTVKLGEGNDTVEAGERLTEDVRLYGGGGFDTLILTGDYEDRLEFGSRTIRDIDRIVLADGYAYTLVTNDRNVATHEALTVDASAAAAVIFDGSIESNGTFAFIGGVWDQTFRGGNGDDVFNMELGGIVHLYGGEGSDTFYMGADLGPDDFIDGGGDPSISEDLDTAYLDGDYPDLELRSSLTGVDFLVLGGGHDYSLIDSFNTTRINQIDGSALGVGDILRVRGGSATVIGGASNDRIQHTSLCDLSRGGTDIAVDCTQVRMGSTLDASDHIQNVDFVLLDGDYSAGVICDDFTLSRIDRIDFGAGFDYRLVLGFGAADNNDLAINGLMDADGDLIIDGSAIHIGKLSFYASTGHCEFTGGDHPDEFLFLDPAVLSSDDRIDGGDGDDTLTLAGDYSSGLSLQSGAIASVERIALDDLAHRGDTFLLSIADANVAAGATLTIDATYADKLTFGGAAEHDGHFVLIGSSGNDSLLGGRMSDVLQGGGGGDTLTGGAGNATDFFKYSFASDSNGANYDTVNGFDFASEDVFEMAGAVTAIDAAVASGPLSTATFDADLSAAAGAGALAGHHAVLFTPNAGTLAGKTFLVVDLNGTAGYQGGIFGDIVVRLSGAQSLGSLNVNDFI